MAVAKHCIIAACSSLDLLGHVQNGHATLCILAASASNDFSSAPDLCRDGVILACEILDCCPWFEFADLDVYVSDEEEEDDEDVVCRLCKPCYDAVPCA